MRYNSEIFIGERAVSIAEPTYFIADIASNHDGDLSLAKDLIYLAKECGADAVKFQHFEADKIVSDYGFSHLKEQLSHQSGWKKSVYEVFKECECDRTWTEELYETAKKAKIDFMSTPYDFAAADLLEKFVPAYKIGSGDITWIDFIEHISAKNKPVFLATGASTMDDVRRAVESILQHNKNIVLMQCNTNYTGSLENFRSVNLNVLKTYSVCYPNMILGLSDHTPGCSAVLGAVGFGARVIEKHFTHDNNLPGPDHPFSMNPSSWKEMVERTRELEYALGDGIKKVEENEKATVIAQQRCVRLKNNLSCGSVIKPEDIECLRPAPLDSIKPYQAKMILGKTLCANKEKGDYLTLSDFMEESDA